MEFANRVDPSQYYDKHDEVQSTLMKDPSVPQIPYVGKYHVMH